MSAARLALRLPRTSPLSTIPRSPRPALRTVNQRRWLRKPPPRARPWAQPPDHNDAHNSNNKNMQPNETPSELPSRNAQLAATLSSAPQSDLLAPVTIPSDPHSVLPHNHPALSILNNSSLVIQRQMEMMNLLLGFEQANRYVILSGSGQTLGYIAETDHGLGRAMARQFFKTHRSFTTHIFDVYEREVLRIHRPFAYINSRIRIYDCVPEGGYPDPTPEGETGLQEVVAAAAQTLSAPQVSPLKLEDMRIIGEAQQQWAPLRRKYNLFTYRPLTPPPNPSDPLLESGEKPDTTTKSLTTTASAPEQAIEAGMAQFAHINEPFLSWDFTLKSQTDATIGSVNRNFAGFARELFTDTGVYALRMDSATQSSTLENPQGETVGEYEREGTALTLDQRAVLLAGAVSVDFDYFSRHSSAVGGGGFMPIFWPIGGGGAAEGGAGGAAGEAGAIEGAAGRGVGASGASEGAMAGAGTMAGYEAMQRGRGGDDASPTAGSEPFEGATPGQQSPGAGHDTWGESGDPWGGGGNDGWIPPPPGAGDGGEGGGGGGGWGDVLSDFFGDE